MRRFGPFLVSGFAPQPYRPIVRAREWVSLEGELYAESFYDGRSSMLPIADFHERDAQIRASRSKRQPRTFFSSRRELGGQMTMRDVVARESCFALLVLVASCSVTPDLSELSCPCASGFVCVMDRCVEGVDDAGPDFADAGTPLDVSLDVPIDIAIDAPTDMGADPLDSSGPSLFTIGEDGGSGTNFEWFRGSLELAATPGEGSFESAVLDAGYEAVWTRFEWTPKGAYGRPFRNAAEPEYDNGNVANAALTLLMPLDAPLGPVSGLYRGLSSAFRTGSIEGFNAESVAGVFDTAAHVTHEDRIGIRLIEGLIPARDDHTFALWFRNEEPCGNQVFAGAEGLLADRSILTLRCSAMGPCQEGTLSVIWTPSARQYFENICTDVDVTDGLWHHVAIRKSFAAVDRIDVWVDGVLRGQGMGDFNGLPFAFRGTDLSLGAQRAGVLSSDVEIDEVIAFARALEDGEIRQLHARGRMDAGFEIRTCDVADCSDGTYSNLRGGAGTSGDEPDQPALPIGYEMRMRGRYAQIRVTMTSTFADLTPEIESMRLVAE